MQPINTINPLTSLNQFSTHLDVIHIMLKMEVAHSSEMAVAAHSSIHC